MSNDHQNKEALKIDTLSSLRLRGLSLISIGILLFTLDKNSSYLCSIMVSSFSLLAGLAGLYFVRVEKRKHIKKNLLLVQSILSIGMALLITKDYLFSENLLYNFLIAIGYFSSIVSIVFFIYLIYLFRNGFKATWKAILSQITH